jgi:ketosteroid isomerase-like protein
MIEDSPKDVMSDKERIAGRVLEILGSLNSESLRQVLTDDVVLELPFAPSEFGNRIVVGLDHVVALMSRSKKVYRHLQFRITARFPVPSADTILFRATSEGVLLNGIRYENEYVQLFVFRGERVCHWAEFFDPIRAKEAFAKLD